MANDDFKICKDSNLPLLRRKKLLLSLKNMLPIGAETMFSGLDSSN
jgi:hypothetical protein